MSQRGRFGKYGETKRFERLRQSRLWKKLAAGEPAAHPPLHAGRPSRPKGVLSPSVRKASPSDAAFISELSRRVFCCYGPYDEILANWFRAGIASTSIVVLAGKPAGFIMLGPLDSADRLHSAAEILAIAVEPARQGRGLGRRLMSAGLEDAVRLGAGTIALHTAEDNLPARRLFESCGFVLLGRKQAFYPQGQDAFLMARSLER